MLDCDLTPILEPMRVKFLLNLVLMEVLLLEMQYKFMQI